MPILIRHADLSADRDELVCFCHNSLPIHPDGRRFDWLYQKNPFGPALTLIASDDKAGNMIGIASAFPRQFWIDGRQQRAWILGDFCISERFRSLGPALTLQRKCMASLPQGEVWYDFPSRNMMAVYHRLGVPLFSQQVRHVRPLKIDRTLGKTGTHLVNALGSLRSWPPRVPSRSTSGIECSLYEGAFGSEFTELDNHPATHRFVRGSRTAEYLNWRYRQNPMESYTVITARRGSTLSGYLVLNSTSREASLCDLLVVDEEAAMPVLLDYVIHLLSATDVERLNVSLLRESVLSPYFRRAGFFARETVPVVVQTRESVSAAGLCDSRSWLLLHGDRES